MEMWMTCEDDKIRFPVTPLFTVSEPWNNQEENLNEVGTINIAGKKGLRSVPIESFFPVKNSGYSFLTFDDNLDPYSYVTKIRAWRESGNPIRFLLTDTPYNFLVLIENFDSGESESTGDVNFSFDLKEYVDIKATLKEEEKPKTTTTTTTNSQTTTTNTYKDYVIKSGDTLWDLAKKFYKNENRWPEIHERNKSVIGDNPHEIKPGWVIKI